MTDSTDTLSDTRRGFMPYPAIPVAHAAGGTLSGLRFAVKDLFDVAGYPTSAGQPLMLALSGVRQHTAPTVQRLLDAGAAFAGKTITDELAFSMNGNNAHFGAPLNGAAPNRISGGSSSGSASAVSHGLVDFALGTDTGGSVRAPASHCGLIGLRPTHGRVSLQAVQDLAPSFDTCGWFARDIDVFARVAQVLMEPDAQPLPATVRLLWPQDLWALAVPGAAQTLQAAAARVQAMLGPVSSVSVVQDDIDTLYWSFRYLQGREAWLTDGPFIERYAPSLGPGVAERFAWSREVTDAQVADATSYRQRFSARLKDLLGDDGVLVLPTMPDVAPLRSDSESALEDYRNRAIRLLCPAGLASLPQLTLPLATRAAAPLGLSLVAPAGRDRSLIELAWRVLAAA